jgi:hypothetical protein
LVVQVTGTGIVPPGAAAVIVNLTATNTTDNTYLTLFPSGAAPNASSLNVVGRETRPNLVTVQLAPDGTMRVFNFAGHVDVVLDVVGYYVNDPSPTSGRVGAVVPVRKADTRDGQSPLDPDEAAYVQFRVIDPVQHPVSALILNVTATNTTGAGYLTIYPDADSPPLASNLNFVAGQTVANLVIVALPPDGRIDIYNAPGSQTDVVIDLMGFVTG